jgi:hypothetical protein
MAKVNNPGHAKPDSRMFKRGYLVNLIRTSAPKSPKRSLPRKKGVALATSLSPLSSPQLLHLGLFWCEHSEDISDAPTAKRRRAAPKAEDAVLKVNRNRPGGRTLGITLLTPRATITRSDKVRLSRSRLTANRNANNCFGHFRRG